MTRDFLIEFDDESRRAPRNGGSRAFWSMGTRRLFGQIDNRGTSLFVTLTYGREVTNEPVFRVNDRAIPLKEAVVFVAIKTACIRARDSPSSRLT